MISEVVPVFKNLLDDSLPEVRSQCAMVLPKMIELIGPTLANVVFEEIFFSLL